VDTESTIRKKWDGLNASMDERVRRLWAGAEADAIGWGGIAAVARATGLAISTVTLGRNEVRAGATPDENLVKTRRRGGGRRPREVAVPEVVSALDKLVNRATRGDPESPLLWTNKSTRTLSAELLSEYGIKAGDRTVARLLRQSGYSLQAAKKTVEGKQHPDRNAQFEYINAKAQSCLDDGIPFISVDTKKKELIGNFKNAGREWHPEDAPELVDVHDFPSDAIGKAIPYGVYDVAANNAFVTVGTDHDTPMFAVASIETWWKRMGAKRYPRATNLFITADAGGSNGYRSHVWKVELQRLADQLGISIHVSHFPPGTSKWNKVEHRLFSFISINWRGRPLRTFETVVSLIGNTTTSKGLVVRAKLDRRRYPTGRKIPAKELRALNIERDVFHGDWNYILHPRAKIV
jgi:transposase